MQMIEALVKENLTQLATKPQAASHKLRQPFPGLSKAPPGRGSWRQKAPDGVETWDIQPHSQKTVPFDPLGQLRRQLSSALRAGLRPVVLCTPLRRQPFPMGASSRLLPPHLRLVACGLRLTELNIPSSDIHYHQYTPSGSNLQDV